MKYMRYVPEKMVSKWEEEYRTCDICGKRTNKLQGWESRHEQNEITIAAAIGDVFPEGDFRGGYRMDCCKKCWLEKVLPALQSLGTVQEFRNEDGEIGWLSDQGVIRKI
jgi:hypothetical protein